MAVQQRVAAALLLGVASAAWAQGEPAQPAAGVSAALVHRRLVERADNGAALVTESGELLRLQGGVQRALSGGGALRASAAVAAGTLDYVGQTQAGVPLSTDSAHREFELGVAWRPLAPARWGEAWLTLDLLQQRRQIASTSSAQGLRETTTLLLPGLRWSHAFDARGWRWQPSVAWRTSIDQRLDIGFGGAFDDARIDVGHRQELALGLEVARAGSPWRWGIAWSRGRQAASAAQPIYRGGVLAGSVREPRIEIDDVMLRATREF